MITIIGEVGRPATQEEIDQFVHTKPWAEMTDQEINKHKRQQCSKCQYLSRKNGKTYLVATPCDYLLITGHRRGCSPLDCVTYGVFKPREKGKRARRIWKG